MRRTKGLYERGRIYWMCYKDINDKIQRESTGMTSQKEAEYVLNDRRREVKEGKSPDTQKINYKFAELAQAYLKWAERQRIYKTKKIWIRQLIEVFGNLNVRDLNTSIIEQWQSERLKRNKPATVNRVLACLKHMVNKGVDWEMASEDTLKKVRKVQLLEENNKRLRFLTIEECQELINCCASHPKADCNSGTSYRDA